MKLFVAWERVSDTCFRVLPPWLAPFQILRLYRVFLYPWLVTASCGLEIQSCWGIGFHSNGILIWFENHYSSRVYLVRRCLKFSVVVSQCWVVTPSSLQLKKILLLLVLVVALLVAGGYETVKL